VLFRSQDFNPKYFKNMKKIFTMIAIVALTTACFGNKANTETTEEGTAIEATATECCKDGECKCDPCECDPCTCAEGGQCAEGAKCAECAAAEGAKCAECVAAEAAAEAPAAE
jgi:hypothetical protein